MALRTRIMEFVPVEPAGILYCPLLHNGKLSPLNLEVLVESFLTSSGRDFKIKTYKEERYVNVLKLFSNPMKMF